MGMLSVEHAHRGVDVHQTSTPRGHHIGRPVMPHRVDGINLLIDFDQGRIHDHGVATDHVLRERPSKPESQLHLGQSFTLQSAWGQRGIHLLGGAGIK